MKVKPIWHKRKWRLGRSFGWWNVPYCGNCKRQLGTLSFDRKDEKCPMCGAEIDWSEEK